MNTSGPLLKDPGTQGMVIVKPCAVCGEASNFRCSGCRIQHYCSKEHQKTDWKARHKSRCRPFTVEHSDALGRYLVATRDLLPGTTILREDPLVVTPKQWTTPLCLGCYRHVGQNSSKCASCGWPMCGVECARTPQHLPECIYTCRRRFSYERNGDTENGEWKIHIRDFDRCHPMYYSVALLRCLYLRDNDENAWQKFISLESHTSQRRLRREREGPGSGEDDWVIKFTIKFFNLEDSDEEDLRKIIGVIMVNGHEVPLPQWMCQEGPTSSFIAVYNMASMIEHNCIPNCTKSFPSLGEIEIRTTVFVPKGERLSISYTDPFWGTIDRKKHLYTTKFFNCNCNRCRDPTELGTFLSAIKCDNCQDGYCVPVTSVVTEVHSLEDILKGYVWTCWGNPDRYAGKEAGCGNIVSFAQAIQLLQIIGAKLSSIEPFNVDSTVNFLRINSGKSLHYNHQYITAARLGLMKLLQGRLRAHEAQNSMVIMKESPESHLLECICKELRQVVDVIVPGMTEIRGILLYELYVKQVYSIVDSLIKQRNPRNMHEESVVYLQESVEILAFEPANSVSAAMAEAGRTIIRKLNDVAGVILS